ncbi:hypothetical protein M758_10G140100 [Ceratodon purpureus]|uniref:Uncharacterized protein n=1 Tax=Ceratodon purpureus TaxID=3225 RepID=A0A8T0GKB4_CERPU|nr:hypothetical protein KC19_10G144900 [Ceratodon purpureus]KAG0604045.1 hypothetical protein M758_10G140100 [Ceratodon purpureus]
MITNAKPRGRLREKQYEGEGILGVNSVCQFVCNSFLLPPPPAKRLDIWSFVQYNSKQYRGCCLSHFPMIVRAGSD